MSKLTVRWGLLAVLTVVLVAFGATRHRVPRTPAERVEHISQRVGCPVCDGQSVAESRHPTANNIRAAIAAEVRAGHATDQEIIDAVTAARGGSEALVPRTSGWQSFAWAMPAAIAMVGCIALGVVYISSRRGRMVVVFGACVVLLAGWALVSQFATARTPGGSAVGGVDRDDVGALLSEARQLQTVNPRQAAAIYERVLAIDTDHPEALAYQGWSLALVAQSETDQHEANRLFVRATALLRRAAERDPTYPDPVCLLGLVYHHRATDDVRARSLLERCQSSHPPRDVARLVDQALAERG